MSSVIYRHTAVLVVLCWFKSDSSKAAHNSPGLLVLTLTCYLFLLQIAGSSSYPALVQPSYLSSAYRWTDAGQIDRLVMRTLCVCLFLSAHSDSASLLYKLFVSLITFAVIYSSILPSHMSFCLLDNGALLCLWGPK